jgi:hypothetical protein
VKGCNFQHKQVLRRNLQEKRLVVLIYQSSNLEFLVYGLTFVQPIRIAETFYTIVHDYVNENKDDEGFQKFEEQIEDFLAYYERT